MKYELTLDTLNDDGTTNSCDKVRATNYLQLASQVNLLIGTIGQKHIQDLQLRIESLEYRMKYAGLESKPMEDDDIPF